MNFDGEPIDHTSSSSSKKRSMKVDDSAAETSAPGSDFDATEVDVEEGIEDDLSWLFQMGGSPKRFEGDSLSAPVNSIGSNRRSHWDTDEPGLDSLAKVIARIKDERCFTDATVKMCTFVLCHPLVFSSGLLVVHPSLSGKSKTFSAVLQPTSCLSAMHRQMAYNLADSMMAGHLCGFIRRQHASCTDHCSRGDPVTKSRRQ